MRPDDAASDHVRCGRSRYAIAPTQAAAIIAALRARRHCTSEFRAGLPALLAAFERLNHRADAVGCQALVTCCVVFEWTLVRLLTGEQPKPHIGAGVAAVVVRIAQSRRPFKRTGPQGGCVEPEPELVIAAVAQGLRFRTEIEQAKQAPAECAARGVARTDARPTCPPIFTIVSGEGSHQTSPAIRMPA
jgi:hypothetical protein